MDLKERFRKKIDFWAGPLGPLGSDEDNAQDMREIGRD